MKAGFRVLLFILAVSTVWTGSARGSLVEYADSVSGKTPVLNQALSVSRFNPALGTLNSATFTLGGQVKSSLTVTVQTPGQYTLTTWDKNDFGGHNRYYFSLLGYSMSAQDAWAGRVVYRDRVDYGTPETFSAPTLSALNSFTFFGSALNPFKGTGALDFLFSANSYDTVSLLRDNPKSSMTTTYDGSVKVVYDYSPVPIPGAVWLLGSGFLSLAALRRKLGRS